MAAAVGGGMAAELEKEYIRMDFLSWDVTFALRNHQPGENRHRRNLSPGQAKKEVLYSPRLQRIIAEVAEDRDCDEQEVEKEMRSILEEMGHKMFLPAVRSIVLLLRPFIRSALHGVYINREGLEQLRHTVKQWPVVLLPSHRSYLDFLLISYVMFEHDITLPYIAAGQDFMKMKMVSGLLRQSGAFFLRRTFGADRLYKAVFSEYVKTVLCSGDAPLEFFIEGTRSRTAKTLHPRLGLLSMVVEPYLAGLLPDIMLVPVSISYQRTLEEHLFSKELLGVPKPPESTRGLMKALSIISEDYGSIFAEIGQPISLHEFCMARGVTRMPHTAYPKDKSVILPSERQVVLELSHVVLDQIHRGMRVYPTAMVAALVLQNSNGLERGELAEELEWLKAEVGQRGARVHWEGDAASNTDFTLGILSSSLDLSSDGKVRPLSLILERPPIPPEYNIDSIARSEVTGEEAQQITDLAFSRLLLSHYRNQLLHLFLAESMLAMCLYHCLPCTQATALSRFEVLHGALAREFVLPLCSPKELFVSCLWTLIDRGYLFLPHGNGNISLNTHRRKGFDFLKNLIQPFLEGVWVVCQYLIMFRGGVQSLNATIKGAQKLAIKCIHTGMMDSYDMLSLELIRNTLASLTQLGLIRQPESEVEGRDRLVKVDNQDRLVGLAMHIDSILDLSEKMTAKL